MFKQTLYIAVLAISFSLSSCKKDIQYDNSQESEDANIQLRQNRNKGLPAKVTTVYFTKNYGNSGRTEFYSVTNLTAPNPKVTLVAAGDRESFPSIHNRWTMSENTNEIWETPGEIITKYSINEYLTPPFNSIANAVSIQEIAVPGSISKSQGIIDYKNNKLYTCSRFGGKIFRTDMDHKVEFPVFKTPNGSEIQCMDVDYNNRIIYYADEGTNSIRSVGTNGSGDKEVIKNAGIIDQVGYEASDIQVDGLNGKIYWIKDNPGTKKLAIMKANTNGTGVTKLWEAAYSASSNTGSHLHFVMDEQSQQIFFIRTRLQINKLAGDNYHQLSLDHLVRMNTEGKNVQVIFTTEYEPVAWSQSELFQLTISKQLEESLSIPNPAPVPYVPEP